MTPAFQLIADDEDVTATLADRLLSLTVTDEEGGSADRLEIQLDDRDGRIVFPETGAMLDVSLGFKGAPLSFMGKYAVDGVAGEGPLLSLSIRATAANMIGNIRAPQTRSWEDVTLTDILSKIAGEAKLVALIAEDIAATHYSFLAQTSESNLHFLTRIARDLNATVKPAAGKLVMLRKGSGKTVTGEDIELFDLPISRLTDWRWRLEERTNYGSVEAEWGDMDGGTTHKILRGDKEPVHKLRHVYATKSEAIRAAEGALDFAGREAFSMSLEIAGFEPRAFAGGLVRLPDMRSGLEGDWQIVTVTHRLDAALVTSLQLKKARADV